MKYFVSTFQRLAHAAWIGSFAIFFMLFGNVSYASNAELLKGQILYVACNGEVADQSDMKHPVENNGATFVSDRLGKEGRACFFDSSDYLRVPQNPVFNLSNFTIAAWVLVEGSSVNGARAIVSNYDRYPESITYQHYGIGMTASGAASVFYDNGSGLEGAKDVGTSLANGEWHHVTAVFQSGVNVALYVDGELKRYSSAIMPEIISPTGDLFIGRGGGSELIEKKWIGSLDEVRVFNRALSEDEVNQLSGIIDLPTGETFTPLGPDENDPFLIESEENPITSVMVTPNSDGSFSLNGISTEVAHFRGGERDLPLETATLVINNGEMILLDETEPDRVAKLNIFGDLEVTDASVPDLKLILPRLDDRYAFLRPSDPSVVARVNHDGTLEITDETQPNVLITYNNRDGSYMIVDNHTNTVTLADRKGNAVLSHPEAPGIKVTFNLFDSEGYYSIIETATNKCVEITDNGLRSFNLKDVGKSILSGIGSGVQSAISTVASNATQSLISGVTAGAKTLAAKAGGAISGVGGLLTTLPVAAKFALAGGAVAVVGGVAAAAIAFKNMKKKIKNLEGQIQTLTAVVQTQAAKIKKLETTVAEQAQTIQRLETTIEELKKIIVQQAQIIKQQAEEIAVLRDTVTQQKEIIAKQAQMIAALEKRIADLEARGTSAGDGVDEIPDGKPAARRASGVRRAGSTTCIEVPEIPTIALKNIIASKVGNDTVIVRWQTQAELGNTGFNLYRAQKDEAGQFINIIQINNMLILTQGNGVEQQAYAYQDNPPSSGEVYYYGIESVDTEGETFLFDNRIIKAQTPMLVTLSEFDATPIQPTNILLQWQTKVEVDSSGFNLWRARVPMDGQCRHRSVESYQEIVKLTDELIAARGSISQGAAYLYKDSLVIPKTTYCYGLEKISRDGLSTFYWDWIATATAQ